VALAPIRRRTARPVASLRIDGLIEHSDELAKAWLIALIEQAPLERVPAIRSTELACDAPVIVSALLRALRSDEELGRIELRGELEQLVGAAGESAGAGDAEEVCAAVDAIRAIIWSALLRAPAASDGALVVDDGALVADLAERLALVIELVRRAALRRLASSAVPWSSGANDLHEALGREIARCREAGLPMSILLVELDDAGRMLAVEAPQRAVGILDRFHGSVRAALSDRGYVAGEVAGRTWLIAPGAGGEQAGELASVLAGSVARAEPWRGAPLRASVGIAVLDQDGPDAASLIEAVEEAALAAAARAIELSRGPGA
jgi:hypothetical protein